MYDTYFVHVAWMIHEYTLKRSFLLKMKSFKTYELVQTNKNSKSMVVVPSNKKEYILIEKVDEAIFWTRWKDFRLILNNIYTLDLFRCHHFVKVKCLWQHNRIATTIFRIHCVCCD